MNTLRTFLWMLVGGFALIVVILGAWELTGLRRSEHSIRNTVIEITPLGSTPEFVLASVREHGWRINGHHYVSGGTSISASRDYRGFPYYILVSSVNVYWDFDSSGRLIEVRVSKTTDGP